MIYNYSQDLNKYNIYKYEFYLINSSFILFYFIFLQWYLTIFYKIWQVYIYTNSMNINIPTNGNLEKCRFSN